MAEDTFAEFDHYCEERNVPNDGEATARAFAQFLRDKFEWTGTYGKLDNSGADYEEATK